MEHLFEALGDLVQAVTYAGLTIFGFHLMELLFYPGTEPEEEEDDK